MCGIVGWVRPDRAPIDARALVTMRDTLAHRGPDGQGMHIEPGCGLGHRRLALLDVRGGAQPMANEDGTVWVVANNEIYNFRELRDTLHARGHAFATATDTEVLIHQYEESGTACLDALVGMYAFAIWDRRQRSLLLARDPFGIKPLYYAVDERGGLRFASEIRALMAVPGIDRTVDLGALREYLRHLAIPEPHTAYAAVRKLPAGHYLLWRDGRVLVRRYWNLPKRVAPAPTGVDLAEVEARLIATTTLTLRSDEPVGLFLSGGLDSSLLAWAIARSGTRPIRTFSVGFDEPLFDESPFSRAVAAALDTEHREIRVTKDEATDAAAHLAATFDEPFADSSAIPTFLLSRAARRSVKAVLAGEGADELFGGSAWHDGAATVPAPPADLIAPPGRLIFPPPLLDALLTPAARARMGDGAVDAAARLACDMPEGVDGLHAQLYADLTTYLPADLLTKMDRMSMLHSLEVRVPYLNHTFAAFIWQLPSTVKHHHGVRKVALQRLAERHLPPAIARRSKQGFAIPMDIWLWQPGRFRDLIYDTLREPPRGALASLFDWSTVQTMLAQHDRLQELHGHRLWTLFVLHRWLERA